MKKSGIGILFTIALLCLPGLPIEARQKICRISLNNELLDVAGNTEFHLTGTTDLIKNSTINLTREDAWLFFDNVKPSLFLSAYKSAVKINNSDLTPGVNARICKYINGTVIVPHASGFQPMSCFNGINYSNDSLNCSTDYYYSDKPGENVPAALRKSMGMFNDTIRSFRLKRGYMATLADNPDGTGYSRVYIADTGDMNIPVLPELLDKKVSFVRVFKWDWVSKKGWCGTTDVEAQADQVDCTWFYSWGASGTSTSNLEFCPEKWGASWPGWSDIATKTGLCHLLGYNEPDHPEQSNVPVVTAVAEWPKALQTGMRLGSPATTDFNWLYQFMDQCAAKNYRVDYVVVHGYWGGLSPQEWYDRLRTVHEKTGKPIWIKEWNNGANWTNESWPSGTAAQQQKQLNDLTGILNVLDTAHFVERYSIYNWVEDKRAMILNWSSSTKSGSLTPAGSFYKSNKSTLAYRPENESVPVWKVTEAPVLDYAYNAETGKIGMKWSDYNGEMIEKYQLEMSTDNGAFKPLLNFNTGKTHSCTVDVPQNGEKSTYYFRLRSTGLDGSVLYSNTVSFQAVNQGLTLLPVYNNKTSLNLFTTPWNSAPLLVTGIPTNHNKFPLFPSIRDLNANYFNFQLASWNYQVAPSLTTTDTLALLTILPGKVFMNGISGWAGSLISVGTTWKACTFPEAFETVPVVLCNAFTRKNTNPSIVQIRNVTTTGFEASIRFEEASNSDTTSESVAYLALTPGTGRWSNGLVRAGLTGVSACGSFLKSAVVNTGDTLRNPQIFGCLQTTTDAIASELRIKKILPAGFEIFQERELSKTTADVSKEQLGWVLFDQDCPNNLPSDPVLSESVHFDPVNQRFTYSEKLAGQKSSLYNLYGRCLSVGKLKDCTTTALPAGAYFLRVENGPKLTFIKN